MASERCPECGDGLNDEERADLYRQRDQLAADLATMTDRMVNAEEALRECARRIMRWREQHGPDACAVMSLSEKMLREVLVPVFAGPDAHRRIR